MGVAKAPAWTRIHTVIEFHAPDAITSPSAIMRVPLTRRIAGVFSRAQPIVVIARCSPSPTRRNGRPSPRQ